MFNFVNNIYIFDDRFNARELRVAKNSTSIYLIISIFVSMTAIFRVLIEGFSNPAIWVLIATGPFFIGLIFYSKKTGKFNISNEFAMTISWFIILYRSINTGGIQSMAVAVFATIPLFNSLICGKNSTLKWTLFSFIGAILVYFAPLFNIEIHGSSSEIVNLIVISMTILAVGIISYSYVKQRNETENQIISSEKKILENEKHLILGSLATGVAHEINNPLSVISLSASLLNTEQDNDQQKKLIEKIEIAEKEIATIVEALQGICIHSTTQNKFLPIKESILPAIQFFSATTSKMKIQVHLEVGKDCESAILPSQLTQVFVHLFKNSIKALKKTKQPYIFIKALKDKNNCKQINIEFTDNGIGINNSDQKKIFYPFYSSANFTNMTGMGLPISKAILKQINGNIKISSTKDDTTFLLTIPSK